MKNNCWQYLNRWILAEFLDHLSKILFYIIHWSISSYTVKAPKESVGLKLSNV